jgi:integrase
MATIIKKGDKWQAQVAKKGVRRAASFPTKGKASAWAAKIEAEILDGLRGEHSSKRFIDALEKYETEVSPGKKGARWELVRIGKFKRLPFAEWKLSDITTPRLAEWRDEQLKTLAASSVNRELNLLSSIFEAARREWRWIKENPVHDLRRPPQPKHRERMFSDEERDSITGALGFVEGYPVETKQQTIALAFLFALETAMRREEIVSLEWERIDLERRFLTLETSKNDDSRQVPLSPRAVELLEIQKGKPKPFDVKPDVLSSLFRRACNKAGVEGAHFHDARATALTRLSRIYNNLELARIVGHRDPRSLMIYYRETAESLASRMWSGS